MGGTALSLPGTLRASVTPADDTVGNHSFLEDQMMEDSSDDLPELEPVPECAICYGMQEAVTLDCGHTFCMSCVQGQLSARWSGSRMTFTYLNCALCRSPMHHEQLQAHLAVHHELRDRAAKVAVQKFIDDGFVDELKQELGPDVTDEEISARAVVDMAVFQCCDCRNPYCAGRMDCATAVQLDEEEALPTKCPDCEWKVLAKFNDHRCMVHGHKFAMFKCDSCCAVATWNCYSNHYCERCHNQAGEAKHYPCPGPGKCELGMPHPPNQEAVHCSGNFASFCIGCTACLGCREAQELDFNENNVFGFQEEDWLSISDGTHLLKMLGEEQVRIRLLVMQPHLVNEIDHLSAQLCAEQLLPLGIVQQRDILEDERIHAEHQAYLNREAVHEDQEMIERWEREEAEAQEKAQRAEEHFWAQHDEGILNSSIVDDFRVLHEQRRSKASLRWAARQTQLKTNSERMQKRLSRQRHARKAKLPRGHQKLQSMQASWSEVDWNSDDANDVWIL